MSSKGRKPKVSFRAPTYFIGGSNSSLARQGGFICFVAGFKRVLWRTINNSMIESKRKITFSERVDSDKIMYFSPPKVLFIS